MYDFKYWGYDMGKMERKDVVFREKSAWQKDDCVYQDAEYKCPNKSTMEATYKGTAIRCCDRVECMIRASNIAKLSQLKPNLNENEA